MATDIMMYGSCYCPECHSPNCERDNGIFCNSARTYVCNTRCIDCEATWRSEYNFYTYSNLRKYRMPLTRYPSDFYGFIVVVDDRLGGEGVDNVAQLVGYAFSELGGEPCDLAGSMHIQGTTEICIEWDSTKTASDDIGARLPDVIKNLKTYLKEGTPIRKTNRAGQGTKGTRLVESLGFDLIGVYAPEGERYGFPNS